MGTSIAPYSPTPSVPKWTKERLERQRTCRKTFMAHSLTIYTYIYALMGLIMQDFFFKIQNGSKTQLDSVACMTVDSVILLALGHTSYWTGQWGIQCGIHVTATAWRCSCADPPAWSRCTLVRTCRRSSKRAGEEKHPLCLFHVMSRICSVAVCLGDHSEPCRKCCTIDKWSSSCVSEGYTVVYHKATLKWNGSLWQGSHFFTPCWTVRPLFTNAVHCFKHAEFIGSFSVNKRFYTPTLHWQIVWM